MAIAFALLYAYLMVKQARLMNSAEIVTEADKARINQDSCLLQQAYSYKTF
jgi:hypothetical protein